MIKYVLQKHQIKIRNQKNIPEDSLLTFINDTCLAFHRFDSKNNILRNFFFLTCSERKIIIIVVKLWITISIRDYTFF